MSSVPELPFDTDTLFLFIGMVLATEEAQKELLQSITRMMTKCGVAHIEMWDNDEEYLTTEGEPEYAVTFFIRKLCQYIAVPAYV